MSEDEKTAVLEEGRPRTGGDECAPTPPTMGLLGTMGTPITLSGPPQPRGSSLRPGARVLGRYLIESLLGEGGMGRIWRAEDLEAGRRVALKEMQTPLGLSPARVEELVLMFRREFFAMKKLQHPGTPKVYDWGMTEAGNRFITMEVVGGQDLSSLVRERPLEAPELYRVLIQMAQVLAFIHSRLYVHCDIKASNVRVTESGAVKLLDFGVMHQLGTPSPGRLKGTLEYLAPEWQRGASIDGRADLYSLGVMAFYLATRRLPFKRGSPAALLAEHLTRPPPRPSSLAPVEPRLEALILTLLAKEPRERFQDATELLEALCRASGEPLPEEPLLARASYLHVPEVVGRAGELEQLLGRLAEAEWGQSRALLLGAPAGVGKSRLLQEFELQAKLAELPFGLGQCRSEGQEPLAPVAQALRALVPLTPMAVLERLGPLLGRLIPSLAVTPPPAFKDGAAEKAAVFGALSEWLRAIGERSAFVLCFEDLQWADSATLEVLNTIIRALHHSRGLVVGAFRSDELSRLSLAFQTVDEGLTSRLELAPLTAEDVDKLVQLALPGLAVPAGFVSRLHELTEGNAFFATECLRALVEEGALLRVGGRWTVVGDLERRALPASVHEAVLVRLGTLPAPRVALLRRLAPAGRSLELSLLRTLAELPEPELFAALDELVERQFLHMVDGRYAFTHDTVHEALYESTPGPERRLYHGRIAEALQERAGDSPQAARAVGWHFARSQQPRRAIEPLLRAGHAAVEARAPLDATLLLSEAARLLEAEPHTPERTEQLLSTWVALIEVGYISDTPTALAYAQKLFAHWAATVDLEAGRRQALAQLESALAAPEGQRDERLGSLVREVVPSAALSPVEVFCKQAELRILQGVAQVVLGRSAEFEALLGQAETEHPEASPWRSGLLLLRGALSLATGRYAGVVESQRRELGRLREVLQAVGRPPRRLAWAWGLGSYFLNMNLALRGEPLDEAALRAGLEVAGAWGFGDIRVYHLFAPVIRAAATGEAGAFVPALTEHMERVRLLGNPRLLERNLLIYTPLYYLERGEGAQLEAVVARGERLARVLPGDRWLQLYVQVYGACLQGLCGEPAVARQALLRALVAARQGGLRLETLVRVCQARLERSQGNLGLALDAARGALARAVDALLGNPLDEILARRALAPLVERQEGLEHLGRARALAEATGNVLQQGWVHLEQAGLCADAAQAARALEQAERAFMKAGATALLPRVAEARERLGDGRAALTTRCGGSP